VPLACAREIGTASSAASSKPVTERAVDAELKLTCLGRLGVTGKRIDILGGHGSAHGQNQEQPNQSKSRNKRRRKVEGHSLGSHQHDSLFVFFVLAFGKNNTGERRKRTSEDGQQVIVKNRRKTMGNGVALFRD
jgi:hypothetical protein